MSDLIDRQAAIDEIDEWIKAFRENGHKESAADACLIQDGIIQLPSAQPEIVRCKDCRHFKQVFAPNDNDGLCGHWHSKCDARTNRNDYCSHAERREVTA